ncbi:MAG: Spo0E family sporulation regulatory protein-aspartic acid phosphatase [Dethiobacteria bacterium]|jgi:uncharacterized protein YoxC
MHHKDKITYLIEELREELHNLLEKAGHINEEILAKSRKLDELLSKYYELPKKE